jgi:glycosyltransferase involved in cell wall biosynthesis
MILGEGKEPGRRAELLELAERLGITDDLAMPGFVDNPYAYMTQSNIFALSSAWEGFANALAEAVACGCPSVSTDCPSGPAEILADGAYGRLVPVGDDAALAEAIEATLDNPPDRARLRRRGAEYSIESSVAKHLETIFDLGRQNGVV